MHVELTFTFKDDNAAQRHHRESMLLMNLPYQVSLISIVRWPLNMIKLVFSQNSIFQHSITNLKINTYCFPWSTKLYMKILVKPLNFSAPVSLTLQN